MDARSREWGTTEAVGTGFSDLDSCESDFWVWGVTVHGRRTQEAFSKDRSVKAG